MTINTNPLPTKSTPNNIPPSLNFLTIHRTPTVHNSFSFLQRTLSKKGDEDRGERIDDGEAGGGDAKDKPMELKCRPGCPEFPHTECVFLPA
ncbi:hypothetical protein L2E82_16205 [Cichorium intybus]|uniref:Uncharacterized protein n=1 Tax=Cichorium intybus TaxID=13427 RepID=A0ACB9F4K0_CICIN|nr:hypothetical protein L2E82_16205 [Cichorium intybus]